MEEESEKRRERLKATRSESDGSSYVNASAAVPGFLANPLLESPQEEFPCPTPRFDFYTDPMAAFSSANRRSGAPSSQAAQFSSTHPGSWNLSMTSSPANQMQNYNSPSQRMHLEQGPHYNAASHGSPRFTPFPMHQAARGGSGRSAYSYSSHRGPYPIPVHEGNPGFQPRGSPNINNSQIWVSNTPNIGSGQRGRGQGQWHGGGRNQFSGQSSGGGRGRRGFHSHGSAPDKELRPESFYDKSMFEDPWQHLEPVVWRGQEDSTNNPHSSSSGSWLAASISKKARVSEPFKQSLAEYLAQSFNEAAGNTPAE